MTCLVNGLIVTLKKLLLKENYMRKKRLLWNTITSFGNQIIAIVCGFILPRIILNAYGSGINGLVSSITQFLGIIAFMEFGVGAVVQSSLYKPLAQKNNYEINAIMSSSNRFFRKIAIIMGVYVFGLCICYPMVVTKYDYLFTILLILAIGISCFMQYYFGITNQLLLIADQRGYFVYTLQAVTVIANTVVCSLLINFGATIQLVKLTTSVIYLLRPLGLYLYVNKTYKINQNVKYSKEPIDQKWNGLAQHISAVILDNTDTIVLTILSTLENVSIYSVYYLVVHGVKQLFLSMTNGIQALLGELWVRQEHEKLKEAFSWTEWVIHTGVIFIFGCTGMLIVPFVQTYTIGIKDANYIVPLFAFLLTLAHACHCLRLPYNIMVLVAGHYKQTQNVYIVTAVLNIVISIITVKWWGLVGVAIGTLVAMAIQTIWLATYLSKKLFEWPIQKTIKQTAVDIMTVAICIFFSKYFSLSSVNYSSWIFLSMKTAVVWMFVIIIINSLFYRDKIIRLYQILHSKIIHN